MNEHQLGVAESTCAAKAFPGAPANRGLLSIVDLSRLVLERAANASEGVDVMGALADEVATTTQLMAIVQPYRRRGGHHQPPHNCTIAIVSRYNRACFDDDSDAVPRVPPSRMPLPRRENHPSLHPTSAVVRDDGRARRDGGEFGYNDNAESLLVVDPREVWSCRALSLVLCSTLRSTQSGGGV